MPKKMRILMIAPQPFYAERGTPMNVRLLCKVLGEAGNKIDLLVFPTGGDIDLKNLRIVRLPNLLNVKSIPVGPSKIKLAYDLLLTAASLCLIVTKKYDVIHGIEESGFLAIILSKLFGIASVLDMDSYISDHLHYSGFVKNSFLLNLVKKFESWSIRKSCVIITVCQALSEKVRGIFPEANIHQIEDIPISYFEKSADPKVDDLIVKYNLSDASRVIYTGNLESYQGIDLLIDSWKLLCDQGNNSKTYCLVMVGGNASQIEHYKKIAAAHGLSDTICWVGQRPSSEMKDWMSLSNVLVSPRSEGENTPLKIYSYMASGRPIVATRRKTHTQVLDDSMAFLADPEPNIFGNAIFRAINENEISKSKAEMAKRIVENKYSYSKFQKKLLAAYNSINTT